MYNFWKRTFESIKPNKSRPKIESIILNQSKNRIATRTDELETTRKSSNVTDILEESKSGWVQNINKWSRSKLSFTMRKVRIDRQRSMENNNTEKDFNESSVEDDKISTGACVGENIENQGNGNNWFGKLNKWNERNRKKYMIRKTKTKERNSATDASSNKTNVINYSLLDDERIPPKVACIMKRLMDDDRSEGWFRNRKQEEESKPSTQTEINESPKNDVERINSMQVQYLDNAKRLESLQAELKAFRTSSRNLSKGTSQRTIQTDTSTKALHNSDDSVCPSRCSSRILDADEPANFQRFLTKINRIESSKRKDMYYERSQSFRSVRDSNSVLKETTKIENQPEKQVFHKEEISKTKKIEKNNIRQSILRERSLRIKNGWIELSSIIGLNNEPVAKEA